MPMVSTPPHSPEANVAPSLMPSSPVALSAVCLLVAAIGIASQFFYIPHHDMSWLLYTAQRVMAGDTLYASLVEVNPPLIVDLSSIGVLISSGLNVTRTHGWVIFVGIQALLCLWLTARLLARELADEAPDLTAPLIALLAWTFTCLPAREFGQREHLMVLWLSPYVVSAVALGSGRPVGRPLQILLGLLVGLAVCLKPYYGVVVALVELCCLAWPARSIRPCVRLEMFVAVAVGVAYITFVRFEHPLFFTWILPLAVQYYSAYGSTLPGVIKPAHLVYAAATVVALVLGRVAPPGVTRLALAFTIAGVGAYITLILQSKGWSYHFLPAKSFLTLTVGISVLAFLRGHLGQWAPLTLRRPAAMAMTGAAAVLASSIGWSVHQVQKHRAGRDYRLVSDFETFFDGQPRRPATLVLLSPSMFPGFPLVETLPASWGIRFNDLWMLAGLLAEEQERPTAPDRVLTMARLSQMLAEDIDASKPQFIIVERHAKLVNTSVDVLALLLPSDRFRRTWQSYTLVQNVSGFEVYGRSPGAVTQTGAR
jgi:hypothetical protein